MKLFALTIAEIIARRFLLGAFLATLLAVCGTSGAAPVSFSSGSLIIPMDTGVNGQNQGMLRAYGLVYELLSYNVPVNWVINPAKPANGDDFAISAANALQDVRTGAVIAPRSYRGGPFVIAASDAAAVLPIIQAWQAVSGDNTAVHHFTGPGSFTSDVSRVLVSAPRIAILKDGYEQIAFNNLNAAGIPDSMGGIWTASSPDLLTEAGVAGPSMINHADGVLFHSPGGLTRYGYLAAMHYVTTVLTPEVVQEVRSSLVATSLGHAFIQCEAIRAFENGVGGFYLTTLGLVDDGSATMFPTVRVPSDPLAQLDGAFEVDSGAVDSFRLAPGSTFRTGVTTLINDNASSLLQRIVLLTGRLDGNPANGRVTYLAGHDYSLDLPITSNPQTNGVRLFLNSILETDCAVTPVQPGVTLTMSAPALTNGNRILYTVTYTNPGPRPVENVQLIDTLPPGTAYIAGSGLPAPSTISGGELTWNLPPLASGASATVTFEVSVSADGTYTNTAQMSVTDLAVRLISSAPATTIRDTVPPSVTIIAGPAGATNNTTPSFQFTTDASAVTSVCAIDNVGFTPCAPAPAQYTSSPLPEGPHTFNVRVTDAAGNTATASRAFTVDVTPPVVTIPGPPTNPTIFGTSTPQIFFSVNEAGAVTFCKIDGGPFAPGASPFTTVPLVDGPHTLSVFAQDAVGNSGPIATFAFVINTTNVASTATNLSAGETYIEDAALNLVNIVVSDVDSANVTATLTLSNVAAGSLSTGTSGAVTSTYGAGVWTASGPIANVNALLAGVSFIPSANFNASFSIATRVSDGIAPAVTGTKAMFGVPVGDAPVLDAARSPVFDTQSKNAGAPVGAVGTRISSLVDFAAPAGQVDNVTDADGSSLLGIAVTAADTTNGTWFYSTNNGATWNALGAVSSAGARLLAADSGTRLYFRPNTNFTGTLTNAITFRAWDQTTGTNGSVTNITTTGGSTAFSSATDTASLTVNLAVLVAIEVTPTNPRVPAGYSQQFTATGTFSDGTRQDLTARVAWSSSSLAVARISNAAGSTGLATGLAVGTTQISARLGSVSGSTTLTVTSAVLVSIQVTPTNPALTAGRLQQFTATGVFSDGTSLDLTTSATWSSSNPAVARISNAAGSQGLATGLAAGTTQITAGAGSVSGSTLLTVTAPISTGGNGSFVIGDLDAVVGAKVYFWGSQWAKKNHLSQGAAPSAFKGWANSIGGPNPIPGDMWSSDPGNSSQPPSSVPSLITVIASSSITKSGSVIKGNIGKTVVILPDPGYGPSPGHVGTGTVISVSEQ